MSTSEVLQAIYDLLCEADVEGVKQIYEPGRPVVFRQNMPAVIIQTATPSRDTEILSSDACVISVSAEIHIITETAYTMTEKRVRGDMMEVMKLAEEIESVLYGADDLGGLVDELIDLTTDHLSPSHSRIRVIYRMREMR